MRRITMAFDRLIENIVKMQNPTVAGLDPKLDYVPESIKTKCFEKYGKTLLHFLNSTRRLLTHFMILFLP
jgi:hypothetical protein